MLAQIKQLFKCYKKKRKLKKINTVLNTIHIADDLKIGEGCILAKRVAINENVEIGNFTYLNAGKYWITVESNVKIGSFCSIAPGAHIGAGNHEYSYVTTHPILFDAYYQKILNIPKNKQLAQGLKDKDETTIIGNDVWIGLNAIIKRGVKIGNGAIIAAGAVVVKDVPDYAIVGGNPAKVIKYRTTEENIQYIAEHSQKMWWNLSKQEISENLDKMYDFDCYLEELKKNN